MENPRRINEGFEENIMAILDTTGIKEARDLEDDSISFLEAVRSASIVSEFGVVPTRKVFEAIFKILKDSSSLELIMASYKLLIELEEKFPRVYLSHSDELIVDKEAWSPFITFSEPSHNENAATMRVSADFPESFNLFQLIEDISQAVCKFDFFKLEIKILRDMMLFKYIVTILERDFLPRSTVYKETMNWVVLKESFLNSLLGSRRMSFKSLIRECLSIISQISSHDNCQLCATHDGHCSENTDSHFALAIAAIDLEKQTCTSVQKVLTLIMEFDVMKKIADIEGITSRADRSRTPIIEIILDELTYNKDLLFPFLQAFSDAKWKLDIILQFFFKYCTKPSVCTRRVKNSSDDKEKTLEEVLKCFSNSASAKNFARKLSPEVAQMLLAHAFQAYLSLLHQPELGVNLDKIIGKCSLEQVCKDLISAFCYIKTKHTEITQFEKEALFTASIILSRKSEAL